MMEHADLVAEMAQIEHLSTQDRLHLARMRRVQQLKLAKQRDKEWLKAYNRRNSIPGVGGKPKRNICFQNSVVLLEAAARNDIGEVARLLQRGVSPDATNDDGLTALHQCCIDNNADMLCLLLDYGANVNALDSEKWTPLHAAATCGHLNLVQILINRGAHLLAVNADGNMPYDLCDDEETLDNIEAEMSKRGITQDLIDETRAATETKMLNDLNMISCVDGDLEVADTQGATPLHIAAANGYSRVVEFLLENNVNVDAVDNDLWTPVHAAACWGHMEILEMLAQSGADLNAKNKNDESPSDICEDVEIRERIEQLKTEQESKRLAEAQRRRVRRSQSNNTRAQSVRRTSLRDKTLTTKKDAVEETKLRLQAQEVYTPLQPGETKPPVPPEKMATAPVTAPSTPISDAPQTVLVGTNANNYTNNSRTDSTHNSGPTNFNNNIYDEQDSAPQTPPTSNQSQLITTSDKYSNNTTMSRRSPEGKDNDAFITGNSKTRKKSIPGNNNKISSDISTEIFSTSNDNGKINVQVTVLVDTHNGDQSTAGTTLADLKKQRAQSRNSSVGIENGGFTQSTNASSTSVGNNTPVEISVLSSPGITRGIPTSMSKYCGVTSDIVSDSTSSKRCCVIL